MIKFKNGDIFIDQAEAIVNTVNCVGVMGRGLALQFKNKYPENFREYQKACKQNFVKPGRMFVFETGELIGPKYIINFPTKRHWKAKSKIEDIQSGLQDLVKTIEQYGISSVAIPPLGSGLGGLPWGLVKNEIIQALNDVSCEVIVYEPLERDVTIQNSQQVPEMTAGRAALIGLMDDYLKGLMMPFVSLLEVHKLMFFLQEAGEPLRLKFTKAAYGPYAENLRHVLKRVEGHFIQGYQDGGDIPDKPLEILPGAGRMASEKLHQAPSTASHFQRVIDLIEGFESPFGLELLSTVYWLNKTEGKSTINSIIDGVHSWNERKKQFTPRQIQIAVEVLQKKHWINL